METGIFYGSTTGNTESAAEKIKDLLKDATIQSISTASIEDFADYDNLIFGCSTWGYGELQDEWEYFIDKLKTASLGGKKIALFGTGDQAAYPDTFMDALGIIYEALETSGAQIIGYWPKEGYTYEASRAEIDDEFVGLVLDDDNQKNLTDERIKKWVADINNIINN